MESVNVSSTQKPPLSRFIETFDDTVQDGWRAVSRRAFEFVFQKFPGSAADGNRTKEET